MEDSVLFGVRLLLLLVVCINLAILATAHLEVKGQCRQKWFNTQQQQQDGDANGKSKSDDVNGDQLNGEGSSFVCVCSAAFCDEPEAVGAFGTDEEQIVMFVSDREQQRLSRKTSKFHAGNEHESAAVPQILITVDPSVRFQTLLGFGGAFTDAVGINLNKLSANARDRLMRAYFDGERGIGYRLGRVPIAGTDFSTREYSYADEEENEDDFELETFDLAREDLEAKIPYIQMANRLSGRKLRLLAVPWSAPGWMKTSGRMAGPGQLKGDVDGPYYWSWARYLKRFFDEYQAHGIHFWAMTLQNHPEGGLDPTIPFQAMFLSNHTQRVFAARLLAPMLRESPHTARLQLLAYDNPREHLVASAHEIFASSEDEHQQQQRHIISSPSSFPSIVSSIGQLLCELFPQQQQLPLLPTFLLTRIQNFCATINDDDDQRSSALLSASLEKDGEGGGKAGVIAGVGLHWYMLNGHEQQSVMHRHFPNKFILPTEACTGFSPPDDAGPRLGNWTRGWMYGHDIVRNMRNWAVGWIDWNLCLDMEGGPNWAGNVVDSPIIVNAERDEFYKQPMFYFLAHFSRYIPPGSVRIQSEFDEPPLVGTMQIDHVAFVTPDLQNVLVLISPPGQQSAVDVGLRVAHSRREATITLQPDSIITVIWKQ